MSACRPTAAVRLVGSHPAVPRLLVDWRQERRPLLQLNRASPPQPHWQGAYGFGSRQAVARWTRSRNAIQLIGMVRAQDVARLRALSALHKVTLNFVTEDELHNFWRMFIAKTFR